MKVSELINALSQFSQDLEVTVNAPFKDSDWGYTDAGGTIDGVRPRVSRKWDTAPMVEIYLDENFASEFDADGNEIKA